MQTVNFDLLDKAEQLNFNLKLKWFDKLKRDRSSASTS